MHVLVLDRFTSVLYNNGGIHLFIHMHSILMPAVFQQKIYPHIRKSCCGFYSLMTSKKTSARRSYRKAPCRVVQKARGCCQGRQCDKELTLAPLQQQGMGRGRQKDAGGIYRISEFASTGEWKKAAEYLGWRTSSERFYFFPHDSGTDGPLCNRLGLLSLKGVVERQQEEGSSNDAQ